MRLQVWVADVEKRNVSAMCYLRLKSSGNVRLSQMQIMPGVNLNDVVRISATRWP
ncbi:MAG: hypothetical protein L0Y80_08660 [Ignavibacteriae bacterium]|nr:hypothetical protein [Ignavibacteriota bacterium]